MKRKFFSCQTSCKSNCAYCFQKQLSYPKFEEFNVDKIDENNVVIYPNCDGDFFDSNFVTLLDKLNLLKKYSVISISTKNDISSVQMKKISLLNTKMTAENLGILKLSVSYSTKSQIKHFEENTLPYDDRIKLSKRIINNGFKYATIIKPILPFIPLKEYYEIINDTIDISPSFIIGDLYVNLKTNFYQKYIHGKYKTYEKSISWLPNNVVWHAVESTELKNAICEYIVNRGGKVFLSDRDFVHSFVDE